MTKKKCVHCVSVRAVYSLIKFNHRIEKSSKIKQYISKFTV